MISRMVSCLGRNQSSITLDIIKTNSSLSNMPEHVSSVVENPPLSSNFVVRVLKEKDIPKLMKLRQHIGVHDAMSCIQTWSTIDPEGIRVIETETGEIVGACSATKQNDDLVFVGLYCIHEDYRGCGLAIKVWNECDEHVGSLNAALNAVPGKLDLYRSRCGYKIIETEYKCIKNYTSVPVNPKHLSSRVPYGVTIEPFQRSHLLYIYDYDFDLMGYRREQALELNCQEQDSRTLVAFKNGRCAGYGTIKTSCLGAGRVGPLYADDPEIAEVMLRRLILSLPKVTCFGMMTISTNIPAKRLLKKLDCPQMQELTRMYRKKKLSIDTSKVYALSDLNFGPF